MLNLKIKLHYFLCNYLNVTNVSKFQSNLSKCQLFHVGGPYHTEASSLTSYASQWTGFYKKETSVMIGFKKSLIISYSVFSRRESSKGCGWYRTTFFLGVSFLKFGWHSLRASELIYMSTVIKETKNWNMLSFLPPLF